MQPRELDIPDRMFSWCLFDENFLATSSNYLGYMIRS